MQQRKGQIQTLLTNNWGKWGRNRVDLGGAGLCRNAPVLLHFGKVLEKDPTRRMSYRRGACEIKDHELKNPSSLPSLRQRRIVWMCKRSWRSRWD